MEQFTQEELANILVLTRKANITGNEATLVALLQQKIAKMIKPPVEEVKEKPENERPIP
jgi:hypothetical protein